jgi:hypothetical protein
MGRLTHPHIRPQPRAVIRGGCFDCAGRQHLDPAQTGGPLVRQRGAQFAVIRYNRAIVLPVQVAGKPTPGSPTNGRRPVGGWLVSRLVLIGIEFTSIPNRITHHVLVTERSTNTTDQAELSSSLRHTLAASDTMGGVPAGGSCSRFCYPRNRYGQSFSCFS